MSDDWSTATNQALEEARQQFILAAALENQKVIDTSHPGSSARTVNGNAAPDSSIQITPIASIVRYSYAYMDGVAQFALQTLRGLSPIGRGGDPHPGLYRDSHMLFIDGHSVPDATGWHPGQVLYVSNPEPYAREVELGSGVKFSAPHNVYQQAQPIVAAKFENSFTVRFDFMPINFASAEALSKTLGSRSGGSTLKPSWLSKQPTLIIAER
ncbi:MAG: hypothetical protein JWP25_8840 [Bradyrhizobium sp.]|nr:hypothetical protein [Bradyrhizobium sp.]